jgi:hypothetical protein
MSSASYVAKAEAKASATGRDDDSGAACGCDNGFCVRHREGGSL